MSKHLNPMKSISKSINHLINRFDFSSKNKKPMYLNSNDVESLSEIAKYIDIRRKEDLNNNHLFAKLFLVILEKEIWKTSNYELALRNVRSYLNESLDSHYEQFQIAMMLYSLDKVCKDLGFPDELDYSKGVTIEQKKSYNKIRANAISDHQLELSKTIIKNKWSKEETTKKLNSLITDIINNYGHTN